MLKPIIWSWEVSKKCDRTDTELLLAFESSTKTDPGLPPHLTRSQIKRLIEEGKVTANGNVLKSSSKLQIGTVVQVEFPPPQPSELIPEDRPLEILFEDEHLLVINKPQGLTVHPSPTQMQGTLVHALLHHIKNLSGIGGILRPGIVHRIDKNTSGALVITKTDQAHSGLSEAFSKHAIERAYWAVCYGAPPGQAGNKPTRIESLIGRSSTDRKKMSTKVKTGRKAVSFFRKIEEYSLPNKKPFASLLEVTLETGRTHQVRVHLTENGHSLLGDPVYGTPSTSHSKWLALPKAVQESVSALPGQALHARVLGFTHPVTGVALHFEANPPLLFEELLVSLRKFS